MDAEAAQQIALGIRQQLIHSGFPEAAVDATLLPVRPGKADLRIEVNKGQEVDIAGVRFSGELGLPEAAVRKALQATRSKTMLPGLWRIRPGYSADAVESDAANLRSFYYRQGYFDAQVTAGSRLLQGGKAWISYAVQSGPHYEIRGANLSAICRNLLEERRTAERQGILDFSARLNISNPDAAGLVDATLSTQQGKPYRVARITFHGNHAISDAVLRHSLLLDEGALLDTTLLRRSLARINDTGFFEPLSLNDAVVYTPPDSDAAEITVRIREKKARFWNISGPAGPMSLAGPLEFTLGSRLPPWGRGLLELSTYTVSAQAMFFSKPLNSLLSFLPNRRFLLLATIRRPPLPGQPFRSGFTVAPQLGWQGMLASYGVSQMRGWARAAFQTNRALTPMLPVTVAKDDSEGTLSCEPPHSKLDRMKQIGGIATGLLFSLSPF